MKNPFKSKAETKAPETKIQQPVQIVIKDTERVKAALELAKAVNKLAGVIEGIGVSATVTNCHFTGIGDGHGLSIVSNLDEI